MKHSQTPCALKKCMKHGLLPKQRHTKKKVRNCIRKSKKRKYCRNTYATPVFARWGKDWESKKRQHYYKCWEDGRSSIEKDGKEIKITT